MSNNLKNKQVQTAQRYVSKGQPRKAIAELEKALRVTPDQQELRLQLAELYAQQGQLEQSMGALSECATSHEQQGFFDQAAAIYRRGTELHPEWSGGFAALGASYAQLQRHKEAHEAFLRAIELYHRAGQHPEKLGVIAAILELDPANLRDRIHLAESYLVLGMVSDALKVFHVVASELERRGLSELFQHCAERILYYQRDNGQLVKRLANSYLGQGLAARALPKLRLAYKKGSKDLETLGLIARAFEQLGQVHKSVLVLKEMARLYKTAGMDQQRDECLGRVLSLDSTDASARAALNLDEPRGALRAGVLEFEHSTPPPAPAMQDRERSDGDILIDDLILDAASDLEVISPAAPPPVPSLEQDPQSQDSGELSWDDDDEIGFDDTDVAEQTLVDSAFIPEEVLAQVQADMPLSGLAMPSFDAPEPAVAEDLRELDFYIKNGLKDEASLLLIELRTRYGEQDFVLDRQGKVDNM